MIKSVYETEGYLLDPHGAVAMVASDNHAGKLDEKKLICLATAHPAKFPDVTRQALNLQDSLPEAGMHVSLERAKDECERLYLCDFSHMDTAIRNAMVSNWRQSRRS